MKNKMSKKSIKDIMKQVVAGCLATFMIVTGFILIPQKAKAAEDIVKDEKYKYIFTVDKLNELVNQGVSFRDAYKEVGNAVEAGTFDFSDFDYRTHTHEGSIGNLCNDMIVNEMNTLLLKFN